MPHFGSASFARIDCAEECDISCHSSSLYWFIGERRLTIFYTISCCETRLCGVLSPKRDFTAHCCITDYGLHYTCPPSAIPLFLFLLHSTHISSSCGISFPNGDMKRSTIPPSNALDLSPERGLVYQARCFLSVERGKSKTRIGSNKTMVKCYNSSTNSVYSIQLTLLP